MCKGYVKRRASDKMQRCSTYVPATRLRQPARRAPRPIPGNYYTVVRLPLGSMYVLPSHSLNVSRVRRSSDEDLWGRREQPMPRRQGGGPVSLGLTRGLKFQLGTPGGANPVPRSPKPYRCTGFAWLYITILNALYRFRL
jgi:hypothetical protein